jgi:anti-anti-sigma factor
MVTAQTATGWRMEVDRGPAWMFVKLHPVEEDIFDERSLAEQIWGLLEQSFTYRLVLELEDIALLQSYLLAQLVLLAKRINSHGGMLRLSGLSPVNREVIHVCRLDDCLPACEDRGEAVMGRRAVRPR